MPRRCNPMPRRCNPYAAPLQPLCRAAATVGAQAVTACTPGCSRVYSRLHTSPSRYVRSFSFLGVTFRRTLPATFVLAAATWVTTLYLYQAGADPNLPFFRLPLALFELTAPALTLLLVPRRVHAWHAPRVVRPAPATPGRPSRHHLATSERPG